MPGPIAAAPLLALATSLLFLSGCCGVELTVEGEPRSAHLATPYDTVDYVRFCVRHGHYDALYDVLSTRTRRRGGPVEDGRPTKLTRFQFSFGFPRTTYGKLDPKAPKEVEELPVAQLIHAASILAVTDQYGADAVPIPGRALVVLHYEPLDPYLTVFVLVNEGDDAKPRWTFGLQETIQLVQARLQGR